MTPAGYRITSRHLGEYWVPTSDAGERQLCQTLPPPSERKVPVVPFVLVEALERVAAHFPGSSVERLQIGAKPKGRRR